jgi:hypothetical protein
MLNGLRGGIVQVSEILVEIDKEIARLQQVRALLAGETPKARRGRKKKVVASAPAKKATKRRLSPEGRKSIADAMKRRWAERKKQQAAK